MHYPGQPVWWLWTPGGGGGSGHRKMEKEPRQAVVVKVGARRVYIKVENGRETWVNPASLALRDPNVTFVGDVHT